MMRVTQFKPVRIAAPEAGNTSKQAAKRTIEIAIEQNEVADMAYVARENSTE